MVPPSRVLHSIKAFKTVTQESEEKSTNQQNYKLNLCMTAAQYQHKDNPRQLHRGSRAAQTCTPDARLGQSME
jgi:hypothetical protein